MSMVHELTLCGLAAAFSNVKYDNNSIRHHRPRPMSTAPTSPWKMNKAQLTQALVELQVVVRKEWTVPELRATLLEEQEHRGLTKHKPLGISHLRLDQLKEKCQEEGLPLPEKPTRGVLMKMLRDNTPPTAEEMVPFGKYKGYKYGEVPDGYLVWAEEEVKANVNHSPDLARLARWSQHRRNATPGVGSSRGDPEENAVVPPPHLRSTPKKAQRSQRTRPLDKEEAATSTGWSEVEESMEEQIKDLEARLGVMKSIHEQEKKMEASKKETSTPRKGVQGYPASPDHN